MASMHPLTRSLAAVLLCSAAGLTPGPVLSAAPPSAPGSGPGASVSPVRQLETAAAIADLGRATRDPVLLIAAARLVIASEARAPVPGPALTVSPVPDALEDPWSVDVLLAEASTLAGTDTALQASIRETAEGRTRGVLTGPSQTDEIILPGQVQRFRFTFASRELADAGVRIKPESKGAALNVEVIDDRGRRVAIGAAPAQFNRPAYLAWAPQRCGAFTVIVRNTSTAPAAYRLSTALSEAGVRACKAAPAHANQRKAGSQR